MLTKTQAIRVKLGGQPGLIHDFPPNPKGMHWRTYNRLRQTADDAGRSELAAVGAEIDE
jgi:hypothetical protein